VPIYDLEDGSIQHQFFLERRRVQIFGGGYANGKTAALSVKSLQLARDYPGSNGLVARETYPKLNDTIRKEIYKWCPKLSVRRWPTKDDNTMYFKNGSVINFRYIAQRGKTAEDGSTTSNLLSATYDWIAVDQIEDPGITYKDFLDLMGRLRGNTPYRPSEGNEDPSLPRVGPQFFMINCNPTHNWFYREIVKPFIFYRDRGIRLPNLMISPKTNEPIMSLYEGPTYINARNLTPEYIESLEATYHGQQKERYILGRWAAFEGLVYPDYSDDLHLITYEQAMDYLDTLCRKHVDVKAIEGYDFGLVSPSCYLLGFRDDLGRVILIDGYYRPGFNVFEQPDLIKSLREPYLGKIDFDDPINADPACFKRQVISGYKSTGETIANIFRDADIRMRPASNDITAGIAKVSAYFNGSRATPSPFHDNYAKGPMLFVAQNLDFWHNEVSNYFWKRNPQNMYVDEPLDRDDHAMDATKYLIARLPDPAEIHIPKAQSLPAWHYWHEVEMRPR